MKNRMLFNLPVTNYIVLAVYLVTWMVVFALFSGGDYFAYGLSFGIIYTLMHLYEMAYRGHFALSADGSVVPCVFISYAILSFILVQKDIWQWPDIPIKVGVLIGFSIFCGHTVVFLSGFLMDNLYSTKEEPEEEKIKPREPEPVHEIIDLPFSIQSFHLLLKEAAGDSPLYSYYGIALWMDKFYFHVLDQLDNNTYEDKESDKEMKIAYSISDSISAHRALVSFEEIRPEEARELFRDWLNEFNAASPDCSD